MKFVVNNKGNRSVGIQGYLLEVSLPNPYYDDEEWIEWCKEVLDEIYNGDTIGKVYTEEEWDIECELEAEAERHLEESGAYDYDLPRRYK